eukprot:Rmarinus@m.22410
MDSNEECPLCLDTIDVSDRNFKPCPCGYQICVWCFHKIKESVDGRCPACRKPYSDDVLISHVDETALEKARGKRDEERKRRYEESEAAQARRRVLMNIRITQPCVVHLSGLPLRLAKEDYLRKPDCMGKYGKIVRLMIATKHSPQNTTSAYVTYSCDEEAADAIRALNAVSIDGYTLRAGIGSNRYCNAFLRTGYCPVPECAFLHEISHEEPGKTKEEIILSALEPNAVSAFKRTLATTSLDMIPTHVSHKASAGHANANRAHSKGLSKAGQRIATDTALPNGSLLPKTASWGSKKDEEDGVDTGPSVLVNDNHTADSSIPNSPSLQPTSTTFCFPSPHSRSPRILGSTSPTLHLVSAHTTMSDKQSREREECNASPDSNTKWDGYSRPRATKEPRQDADFRDRQRSREPSNEDSGSQRSGQGKHLDSSQSDDVDNGGTHDSGDCKQVEEHHSREKSGTGRDRPDRKDGHRRMGDRDDHPSVDRDDRGDPDREGERGRSMGSLSGGRWNGGGARTRSGSRGRSAVPPPGFEGVVPEHDRTKRDRSDRGRLYERGTRGPPGPPPGFSPTKMDLGNREKKAEASDRRDDRDEEVGETFVVQMSSVEGSSNRKDFSGPRLDQRSEQAAASAQPQVTPEAVVDELAARALDDNPHPAASESARESADPEGNDFLRLIAAIGWPASGAHAAANEELWLMGASNGLPISGRTKSRLAAANFSPEASPPNGRYDGGYGAKTSGPASDAAGTSQEPGRQSGSEGNVTPRGATRSRFAFARGSPENGPTSHTGLPNDLLPPPPPGGRSNMFEDVQSHTQLEDEWRKALKSMLPDTELTFGPSAGFFGGDRGTAPSQTASHTHPHTTGTNAKREEDPTAYWFGATGNQSRSMDPYAVRSGQGQPPPHSHSQAASFASGSARASDGVVPSSPPKTSRPSPHHSPGHHPPGQNRPAPSGSYAIGRHPPSQNFSSPTRPSHPPQHQQHPSQIPQHTQQLHHQSHYAQGPHAQMQWSQQRSYQSSEPATVLSTAHHQRAQGAQRAQGSSEQRQSRPPPHLIS